MNLFAEIGNYQSRTSDQQINRFADFEKCRSDDEWQVTSDMQDYGFRISEYPNRKSKIANPKWRDGPMTR